MSLGGASKECVHATAKTALIEHSLLHTYITYILEAFFSFTLQVLPVCNACNLSCFFACLQTEKKTSQLVRLHLLQSMLFHALAANDPLATSRAEGSPSHEVSLQIPVAH